MTQGLLYFASSAPVDLFAYRSRIGDMPAYSTVSRALKGLSEYEAAITLDHGQDPTKFRVLQFDNVQNYLRQRDHRIGRQNKMNIGLAGTYIELEGVDGVAFDLDDKRRRQAERKRADLSVEGLFGMIDWDHIERVCALHWLFTLVHYVPSWRNSRNTLRCYLKPEAVAYGFPYKPQKFTP